jgi:hypothetical protein
LRHLPPCSAPPCAPPYFKNELMIFRCKALRCSGSWQLRRDEKRMNGNENDVNGQFIVFHADFIEFSCQEPLRQRGFAGIVHAFIPLL